MIGLEIAHKLFSVPPLNPHRAAAGQRRSQTLMAQTSAGTYTVGRFCTTSTCGERTLTHAR